MRESDLKIIKIIIKASSMKHPASWQTAQRLASRNRKYIWCHPEAKLRKVSVGNVFWKREFGTLCENGCSHHSVPCSTSTWQLPEEKARTPSALGNTSPALHPRVLRLVTLGLQ